MMDDDVTFAQLLSHLREVLTNADEAALDNDLALSAAADATGVSVGKAVMYALRLEALRSGYPDLP
jgi:hypothetical protein